MLSCFKERIGLPEAGFNDGAGTAATAWSGYSAATGGISKAVSQLWWSEGYFLSMLTMPRRKAIQVVDNENKIFIKDICYPAMIFFNKRQNLLIAAGLSFSGAGIWLLSDGAGSLRQFSRRRYLCHYRQGPGPRSGIPPSIDLPGSPPQTKYPILFPGLLALVWKMWPEFPQNVLLMKWLTLLCGGAAVGLCYLYLTRCDYFARSYALCSGLLCATSPMFLYYATQVLSEISFLLLSYCGFVGLRWAT